MPREGRIQIIKYAPPPPELPIYRQVDPKDVVFFGKTNYIAGLEEKRFIFGIKRKDRRRHMYIIGKSGVGKSKMLELMLRQDIQYGHGLCLIDPHGDVIEDVLKFIPEERVEDTVLVDPSDTGWPISFNPLQNVNPELKHQVAQGLIEVMEKQFGANWTPRLEHVFRFTVLALLDFPRATMRGMISMLTDRKYRQKVIDYIEDEMVKRFWAIEFADWSEKFDTEAIIPLVNKLGQFLANPYLRYVFGQNENKVDLEKIMNDKKILLINLSKGKLGEENSSFFGAMFITKIKQAGMSRAAVPEESREDFYLYVDEFHNLVTATFVNIFSEARKYGISLTVAHQFFGQLIPHVRESVIGNVGTMVIFRVGGDDAAKLEAEMTPVFKAKDMVNLGTQQFYIKMTIDGDTYDPFSAETLKILPPLHESFKDRIVEFSRGTYAAPVDEVKRKIADEEAELLGLPTQAGPPPSISTKEQDVSREIESPPEDSPPEPIV
ncbi:MAG: type IV secretion system DNA-binding domain-containing protein [Patescibacteria group bacterium]